MTKQDFIRSNLTLANEQIVAAWESDPSRFVPVPSKGVASWLAGGGRYTKLDKFVDSTPPAELPPEIAAQYGIAQSAVATVFLVANNPTMEVLLNPGTEHRQLFDGLVQLKVLTADDATALIARAVVPGLEESLTSDEIDAERKQADRDTIAAGLIDQSRAWEQTQTAAIAGRAATFVTAVESWRANGGDVPEIASV